jgi:hypothetical protein
MLPELEKTERSWLTLVSARNNTPDELRFQAAYVYLALNPLKYNAIRLKS